MKIGQRVQVHYSWMWHEMSGAHTPVGCHGIKGTVCAITQGPGPINAAVKIELWPDSPDCFIEIFPVKHLQRIK